MSNPVFVSFPILSTLKARSTHVQTQSCCIQSSCVASWISSGGRNIVDSVPAWRSSSCGLRSLEPKIENRSIARHRTENWHHRFDTWFSTAGFRGVISRILCGRPREKAQPKGSVIVRNGIVYVVNYQAEEVLSRNPLVGNCSEPVTPGWWKFSVHPPLAELLPVLVCWLVYNHAGLSIQLDLVWVNFW